MLWMALTMVAQYDRKHYEAMEDYLRIIGFRHKRRNIPPGLYADWRDCMLDVLEEFHGDVWCDPLEQQPNEAVDQAVDPAAWEHDQSPSPTLFAKALERLAQHVDLNRDPKRKHGPQKPRPQQSSGQKNHHVPAAKLLAKKSPQQTTNNQSKRRL